MAKYATLNEAMVAKDELGEAELRYKLLAEAFEDEPQLRSQLNPQLERAKAEILRLRAIAPSPTDSSDGQTTPARWLRSMPTASASRANPAPLVDIARHCVIPDDIAFTRYNELIAPELPGMGVVLDQWQEDIWYAALGLREDGSLACDVMGVTLSIAGRPGKRGASWSASSRSACRGQARWWCGRRTMTGRRRRR
jgi:hypothetical protein